MPLHVRIKNLDENDSTFSLITHAVVLLHPKLNMANKCWDLGKIAHVLSFLLGKLTLAPQKTRKKGSPAANLLAGEDILRGGNCSEQTANMCVCVLL